MKIYIVIPAHNEEAYLAQTLQSLVEQTLLPKKIVVVNDASTDGTQEIIDRFSKEHSFIAGLPHFTPGKHEPGSKVVTAFYSGFDVLDDEFDVLCKFDADLIFPPNYLERIVSHFKENPRCGMAGGFCYIEKQGTCQLENLTNKDHIRGALKAYRKECFQQIGGLRKTMGWDTVDELLAQYHGWEVKTDSTLHVKHLKPTGKVYSQTARYKQGEAFYKMRYGFWLTGIAAAKLALKKNSFRFFMDCLKGYGMARNKGWNYIVTEKEGKYIRQLRWKNIKRKIWG